MKRISIPIVLFAVAQQSCVVAGGYSSDGGWYIWPGSLITVLAVVILAIVLFRRRR